MVVIVRSFRVPAPELQNLGRIPSTEYLRPSHCPSCKVAAGERGKLKIVGHGLYRRQVLGLDDAPERCVIHIRRFICLMCKRTASVLPDELHPRRWYSAAAILSALVLHLLQGQSAAAVHAMITGVQSSGRWKSLERWQRQLFCPLWRWEAPQLGHAQPDLSPTRAKSRSRLQRLLGRYGGADGDPPRKLKKVACDSLADTAHSRDKSWTPARTA